MGASNTQTLMSAGGLAISGTLGTNTKIGLGLDLMSAYSNYRASRAQAEAQAEAIRAQGIQAIKTMTYALSNFENERRNAYEASVQQLTSIRLGARGLEASVANSTGEYQSGKTAKLLNRSTRADSLRTTAQVKDNYIRKSDEIDINKERTFINTKEYLSKLQAPRVPTLLGGILSQAGTLLSSYNAYKNMNTNKITKVGLGVAQGGTSGQYVEAGWRPTLEYTSPTANPWRVDTSNGFYLSSVRNGVLGYTVKDPKAINYGNPNYVFDESSAKYKWNTNDNQTYFNGGQI